MSGQLSEFLRNRSDTGPRATGITNSCGKGNMPQLDVSAVTRIARQVAFQQAVPLEVVGVLRSGPGSGYVEILVNIDDCTGDPCQFLIGVFRNLSESALVTDIASRLRRLYENHRRS